MTPAQFEIDARRVRRILLAVIGALTVASLLAQVLQHLLGYSTAGGWVSLFDANQEGNLPSYYSALSLLACGVLFAVIAASERPFSKPRARRWAVLAVLGMAASVDEAASLHEILEAQVARAIPASGFLQYWWVIPGALAVLTVAIAYRPFVAQLTPGLRRALTWGGALWVGSALLIDIIEVRLVSTSQGSPGFDHAVVSTLQETGEMLGVLLILDGLLRHLAARNVLLIGAVTQKAVQEYAPPTRAYDGVEYQESRLGPG